MKARLLDTEAPAMSGIRSSAGGGAGFDGAVFPPSSVNVLTELIRLARASLSAAAAASAAATSAAMRSCSCCQRAWAD